MRHISKLYQITHSILIVHFVFSLYYVTDPLCAYVTLCNTPVIPHQNTLTEWLTERELNTRRKHLPLGRQGERTHPIFSLLPTVAPAHTGGRKCRHPNSAYYGKGTLSSSSLGSRWSTSLTAFFKLSKQFSVSFAFYSFLCNSIEAKKKTNKKHLTRHRFWPSRYIQRGKLEERSRPLTLA